MASRAQEIRSYLLENIPRHPKDIVAITSEAFAVTRMTVHRHLDRLLKDKKIIRTGTTRGATYFLKNSLDKTLIFEIQPGLKEDAVWQEYLQDEFSGLPDPVLEICAYGFAEIFNNALTHSEGKGVVVKTVWKKDSLELNIIDDGIGIFRKIQNALDLADEREGVLHLSKGKFTTDPERHSGEGLFFTSRVFDVFGLFSEGLFYCKDNLQDDWFLERRKRDKSKGTKVSMAIRFDTKRTLGDVVNFFSRTESELPLLDTTEIRVQLSKLEEEHYVSRSQAKRVLLGVEKFRRVVLDFKHVATVGQAFVDEVFRVFKSSHPEIEVDSVNANENVRFMIEKSLPDSFGPLTGAVSPV